MKKNNTFTTFGLPSREIVPQGGCCEVQTVCGASLRCRWHCHREFEFTGISAGNGRLLAGSVWQDFSPGHLALFGSFLPHYYASAPDAGYFHSSVLKFRRDSLGDGFFMLPEARSISTMLKRAGSGLIFEHARDLVAELKALVAEEDPAARLAGFVLFLTHAAAAPAHPLLTEPVDAGRLPGLRDEKRLGLALDYLHENFRRPGVRLAAAAAAGMEPENFGRFFRKYMGRSFTEHLAALRIDTAARMLLDGTRPVSEIALETGFANLSNFNRLFRKFRGMTPRECRRSR